MFCWVKQCNVDNPDPECFDASVSHIMCQHGEEECAQDLLEGCAFDIAGSIHNAWSFLLCFEGRHRSDLRQARACAEESSIDYEKLSQCTQDNQGVAIDVANAKATAKLGPAKMGTPWVLLNGELLDGGPPYHNVLQSVCESLQQEHGEGTAGSSLPPGCQQ